MAPDRKITASQRKNTIIKISRNAAVRLRRFTDPSVSKKYNLDE